MLAVAVFAGCCAAVVGWSLWVDRWIDSEVQSMSVAGDRVLQVEVGTCNAEHRTTLRESATEVRVRFEHRRNTKDTCLDRVTIRLEGPLAGRPVLDAATGEVLDPTDQ